MKLNTNISIENIITIVTLICSVILAFGFMQYDIDAISTTIVTTFSSDIFVFNFISPVFTRPVSSS